jgi:Na+/phosphate symporter
MTRRDSALMAAMVGAAVTFLFVVMPVIPLVVFPLVIAGILVAAWIEDQSWLPLGAFLIGAGALLFAMEAMSRANDLADPAVMVPGWTPVPLAIGVAAVILGTSLSVANLSRTRG